MAENPRIEELRRRVQADPASIAFAALAEEFRRVGRNEDAIDTCRTGLQRHPAYLSARVTLGRALIETGEYDAARVELETVLRSAPENLAAIRGLATINERLGHSNEMDPHLADMMKTMHAESIRAAAVKPAPPPAPVVAPVPVFVAEPVEAKPATGEEPAPQLEAAPALAPDPAFQPAAQFEIDAPADGFQTEPQFAPEPDLDPQSLPQTSPFDPAPWREALLQTEAELDLSLSPPLGGGASADADLAIMLQAEPEPMLGADAEVLGANAEVLGADAEVLGADAEMLDADAGPDAETLATLARLERFLGAIQSLRA